ncbi:MAG: peptidylprolyl isomerase [Chloroflexota bacterium]
MVKKSNLKVADDVVVSLAYTLRLDNGEIFDTSDGRQPLQFIQGLGQIIPGLETALYGLGVGERKGVVVEPAEGYGDLDPEAFRLVPRDLFPADLELTEGLGLRLLDSETGEPMEALVDEILPDGVVLDFNHPLAGETLHFQVEVVGLRPASADELAHGHVH